MGIIGGGGIATHHLRGYQQAGATVVMVADVQESAARSHAERLGCAWATDYHTLLARDDIQAVSICTPNARHFEAAKAAIEAGKAVLCEKPMTTSAADAEALVRLVRERKAFFQVAYMKRYHPVMRKFKELVPQIGKPVAGLVRCYQPMPESNWARAQSWHFSKEGAGGGPLVHGGSHTLDLLHWVLGDVAAVSAHVVTRPGMEVDWVTTGVLEMANGATLALEVGWLGHSNAGPRHDGWDEMIQICGVDGILTLSTTFWNRLELVPSVELYTETSRSTQVFAEGPVDYFVEEIEDFVHRVETGLEPAITVEDGWWVDRLIEGIYQASAEQKRLPLS